MPRPEEKTKRTGNLLAFSAKAGVAYAVSAFAIGFLLGSARVLLLNGIVAQVQASK